MKYHLYTFLLLIACLALPCLNAYAQDDEPDGWANDPLKKPKIWQTLKEDPTDAAAWEAYMGSPVSKLSDKDLGRYASWKQQLMLQRLTENEAIVGLVISDQMMDDFFIDEQAFTEFDRLIKETLASSEPGITRADLAGVEAIIMTEREDLSYLKRNIKQNFAIIEDVYQEIFAEYKVEYEFYQDKYPDGSYSQTKWIEDHEIKLKQLRDDQIKKLQSRYKVD
ncbi:MAG: hypothetical protein ACFCUI_00795 [Bernardetiaceae bacterium]